MNGDHTSDSSARSLSPGIASLANLGNTCFLNSVLYTLRFTPGFCHSLHHLNQDLQAKARQENGRQKAADSDQEHLLEVIHTLHHLFQKLCSSDACSGDPKVIHIFIIFCGGSVGESSRYVFTMRIYSTVMQNESYNIKNYPSCTVRIHFFF
jgi:hypothetical protein